MPLPIPRDRGARGAAGIMLAGVLLIGLLAVTVLAPSAAFAPLRDLADRPGSPRSERQQRRPAAWPR